MYAEINNTSDICLTSAERAEFFEVIEPTLHISSQEQFFKWTQTDLQRIFPHGKLICGTGRLCKNGAQIRHVMGCNFPPEYLQALQRPDGLTSSPILTKWMKEQQPVLFHPSPEIVAPAPLTEWLDNFRRFELINIAAHGHCDAESHNASYFSFSSIPGTLNRRHTYLLKLLVPHLHVTLVRVVTSPGFKKSNASTQKTKLSVREKEILQWLASGKSNWEIAQVIGLSEATVKNHVHRVLGRLQVSTRAQAVAKAINHKLISARLAVLLSAGHGLLLNIQASLIDSLHLVV